MKQKPQNLPDFSGKCINLSLISDEAMCDLFDPHFEMQGGRLFITGTIPPGATASDWSVNQVGAVAWDRVSDYRLFGSLEDFTEAVRISNSGKKKKKK